MTSFVEVLPERAYIVWTLDVPALELDIFVLQGFHVKSNCWNGIHSLVHFEFVKDGGLTSGVKAEEEDANISSDWSKSGPDWSE